MFDRDTFAARHEEPEFAADPVVALLAERERLCDLAAETLAAAEDRDDPCREAPGRGAGFIC
jgi:hypothetical protein